MTHGKINEIVISSCALDDTKYNPTRSEVEKLRRRMQKRFACTLSTFSLCNVSQPRRLFKGVPNREGK